MMDIYFESNYGKLCEVIERGHCEVFTHSSSLGIIRQGSQHFSGHSLSDTN